ncbi:GNAT family N-acetyltransferase [Thermoactinomyces daqus]|uniref:GNAT family N-acetyltransferase n=1 Tax=Thermoactinomyces daqus TaxID=1329516 RepID=A0A7W2AJ35_9BACL|nr:GNAT family N-acetyltransferase [Thermoactinomyces daqus]MBA4543885.1 GNAT family N-acetyltransferase [Thermoactinomyces daqus]
MDLTRPYRVEKGQYYISTDRKRLDLSVIQQFLNHQSYWAQNRTLEQIKRTINHSLCFGLYTTDGNQAGFGVVTDYTTFGYLADVFILPEHRKQGLSKWLLETILNCPCLADIHQFTLYTRDAHGLYAQFGFKRLEDPERFDKFMELFLAHKKFPQTKKSRTL